MDRRIFQVKFNVFHLSGTGCEVSTILFIYDIGEFSTILYKI